MRFFLAATLALVACGKKTDAPASGSAAGSSSSPEAKGSDKPAPVATGPGVNIKDDNVPEMSGSYDKAFGKLANADEPTTIAFVRGCPALACTDNVFEIESIKDKCPNAFLAIATIQGQDPKPGHHRSSLALSSAHSTATLDKVRLEISAIGPDGIEGTAEHKTTESSVSGSFKAEICGRQ